jgi:spore maturation protein CgeB
MAENGWCPSGRLFEAAACGTPIVSDAWAGLETFLEPGREVIVARHAQDVAAALEMPDTQLAQIANDARERVLALHSSDHRAAELERMLGEVPAAQAA